MSAKTPPRSSSSAALLVVDHRALAITAADWLAHRIQAVLACKERCSFALSGGNTPGPIYRSLASMTLPWYRVDFYFADERCVPPSHEQSNFRLADETLFRPIKARAEQIYRMQGEKDDQEKAALRYERSLPPTLDVVLLGIGEDGHVASIFPESPALEERDRRTLCIRGRTPPVLRLTLTMAVLQDASNVLMVGSGARKCPVIARIFAGEDLPASRLTTAVWLLDRAAAGHARW